MVRKYLILILIFVIIIILVIICTCCLAGSKLNTKEVKNTPKWVDEYNKLTVGDIHRVDEHTFETTINNNKGKIKIFSEFKSGEKTFQLICKINKKTQRLLQSKNGFENARWSVNKLYFSVEKITDSKDESNGDIYVYRVTNNKVKLVYSERSVGFNPACFSNDSKRFAYWAKGRGFTVVDLGTGKKCVHKIPVDGKVAGTGLLAWRKDDKEIFLNCYVGKSYKNYVISNF